MAEKPAPKPASYIEAVNRNSVLGRYFRHLIKFALIGLFPIICGGCTAKSPVLRAPAPQAKPADSQKEEKKQENKAEKPKDEVKKPKEEQLKIDIQKCDYYGTCPVV